MFVLVTDSPQKSPESNSGIINSTLDYFENFVEMVEKEHAHGS